MTDEPQADPTIRAAGPEDVPVLLSLIRELAEFERLADQVTATAEVMTESLFGPRPVAEALMIEYRGEPAGYSIFFHNFSTFIGRPGLYVEDVYIRPTFRRLGLARAVFRHLAKLALDRNCARLELAVLGWNEPALNLYRGLGAKHLREWRLYRFDEEGVAELVNEL
jgi:GNAT superfamily N-acetyltransferase